MTIYFLSGLGADSRVLKYLEIPLSFKLVFIDWVAPESNESITKYAQRIAMKIDTTEPFILVGLSFGGMLVVEIMQFVTPRKAILISSVSRRQELPFYYKLAGILKLNKLIPNKTTHKLNFLSFWFFGISDGKDKELLRDLMSPNTEFYRWAVNQILNWKRKVSPANIIRIHGNKDRILPIINFKPQYNISKGGHFMVVNKAEEISKILTSEISFS